LQDSHRIAAKNKIKNVLAEYPKAAFVDEGGNLVSGKLKVVVGDDGLVYVVSGVDLTKFDGDLSNLSVDLSSSDISQLPEYIGKLKKRIGQNLKDKTSVLIIHAKGEKFFIDGVEKSASEIAALVPAGDEPILLLSCGNIDAAKDLAKQLNRTIRTNDGITLLHSDGGITTLNKDGTAPAKWYEIKPDGTQVEYAFKEGTTVEGEYVELGLLDWFKKKKTEDFTKTEIESTQVNSNQDVSVSDNELEETVNVEAKNELVEEFKIKKVTVREFISLEEAQKYFDECKNLKVYKSNGEIVSLNYDFPEEFCHLRAHEMAEYFKKKGIDCDKIFIVSTNYKGLGNLAAESATLKDATGQPLFFEWLFHVAPVVKIDNNGNLIKYVIDPSIFDRPVTIDEWIKSISIAKFKKVEISTLREDYFKNKNIYFKDQKFKDNINIYTFTETKYINLNQAIYQQPNSDILKNFVDIGLETVSENKLQAEINSKCSPIVIKIKKSNYNDIGGGEYNDLVSDLKSTYPLEDLYTALKNLKSYDDRFAKDLIGDNAVIILKLMESIDYKNNSASLIRMIRVYPQRDRIKLVQDFPYYINKYVSRCKNISFDDFVKAVSAK